MILDVLSDVSLFADDTRIVKPITDFDDVENLQEDLETLYQWQDQNNMKLIITRSSISQVSPKI